MAKAKKITSSRKSPKPSSRISSPKTVSLSKKGIFLWRSFKKEITWQDVVSLILVLIGFAVFYSLYLDDKKDKQRADAIQACIQTCNNQRHSQDDMCIMKCNQDPKFDVTDKTELYF